MIEVVQGSGARDVVDQEEGVGGVQGGRREERPVFFLAGRVGQGEEVGLAGDGAGGGVRVFDCWVVTVGE